MLHVDEKYAERISFLVRNYSKKKPGLYNFSCPICGDSDTVLTKARGYLYPNQDRSGLVYKCHNCTRSISFSNLLKDCFGSVYPEYQIEKCTFRYKSWNPYQEIEKNPPKKREVTISSIDLPNLNKMKPHTLAYKWAEKRCIPEDSRSRIFFTEDFHSTVQELFPGRYPNIPKNDPRIVLPFFDSSKNLIGIQGRAILDSKMRYITCRASENDKLVFGLEEVDFSKRVYVVEGPIDSLFLPNSLAVASSDLYSIYYRVGNLSNVVLIFDNEPRNKEICKLMNKAIEKGAQVCIWPDTMHEKDINDMILSGMGEDKILDVIETNIRKGIEAKVAFSSWKRV